MHLLLKFCYDLRTLKAFKQTCYKCKVYRRAELLSSTISVPGTSQQKYKPLFAITSSSGSTKEASTESSTLSKHCWAQLQSPLSTKTTQHFSLESIPDILKRNSSGSPIWETSLLLAMSLNNTLSGSLLHQLVPEKVVRLMHSWSSSGYCPFTSSWPRRSQDV